MEHREQRLVTEREVWEMLSPANQWFAAGAVNTSRRIYGVDRQGNRLEVETLVFDTRPPKAEPTHSRAVAVERIITVDEPNYTLKTETDA